MTPRPRVAFALEVPRGAIPPRFRRDAVRAVGAAGLTGAVSVAVVGDAAMRRVNRDFHGVDAATDVLAFPLGGAPGGFDAEIVVSLDTARRVAAERGEDAAAELMLYVVHGALHLAGFDDYAAADARRMHARALAILAGLGYRTTMEVRAKPRPRRRRTRGQRP